MRSRLSSATFPERAMWRDIVTVVTSASRFDLSGRIALVTGASRGIGSAIAEALAEHGAKVVLSSRKQEGVDAEAARINERWPGKAEGVAAHAGRQEDLERLVTTVMERHGRIDILVNNAATNPYFGPLMDMDMPAWDKTFEVNLRGVFFLTKLVYNASMERNGGSVVNIASVGGPALWARRGSGCRSPRPPPTASGGKCRWLGGGGGSRRPGARRAVAGLAV